MWKLKCFDDGKITEKVVKLKNVIGRDEIRSFFADNGYATMSSEIENIMSIHKGEKLRFDFGKVTKYIEVERCDYE